jgi:hypothetical protein
MVASKQSRMIKIIRLLLLIIFVAYLFLLGCVLGFVGADLSGFGDGLACDQPVGILWPLCCDGFYVPCVYLLPF